MFDTKLKLRYLMLDWKYWLKNWRSVRNETTHKTDPGWSGRWWRWRDPGPQTSDPPTLTMRDLNKWKNINTHPIYRSSLYLLYTGLAIELIFKYLPTKCVGFLMWSQITFLLSIRRTGSQQIDFKVLSHFECQNIL